MSLDLILDGLIAQARADLAQRLGLSTEAILLIEAKATDWMDASLGCPKRGVNYIRGVTPGYQILLEANGQAYDYRSDGRRMFLCEQS